MASDYIFSEIRSPELIILFVYLQTITKGTDSYFIFFKKLENGKNARIINSFFYEKCLGSYQECEGSENLFYFQSTI